MNSKVFIFAAMLISACSQGGREGVSIPGDSHLAQTPKNPSSKISNPLYAGRIAARKKITYGFSQPEKEVLSALELGTLSSLKPSYRTDYSFDKLGRLQEEITTAYRGDPSNELSIIPIDGATLASSYWNYDTSELWKSNAIEKKMYGFQSDTDHGQKNNESIDVFIWDSDELKSREKVITHYSDNAGMWDKHIETENYAYHISDGRTTSIEMFSNSTENISSKYIYSSGPEKNLLSVTNYSLNNTQTHNYVYNDDNTLTSYSYKENLGHLFEGEIPEDNTLLLKRQSNYNYIYQNILNQYEPQVQIEVISESINQDKMEYTETRVTLYQTNYCHESNFYSHLFTSPQNWSCHELTRWKKRVTPISKTFTPGELLHINGKCIHPKGGANKPKNGTSLVLWPNCDSERGAAFLEFTDDNNIRLPANNSCIRTEKGAIASGVPLIISSTCETSDLPFQVTHQGQIQVIGSQLCIQPDSEESNTTLRLQPCNEFNEMQRFVSVAKLSRSLKHKGGLCFSIPEQTTNDKTGEDVILSKDCSSADSQFTLLPNGMLLHLASGQCLHPLGGAEVPGNGTHLIAFPNCNFEERLAFEITNMGSLRHKLSNKCIHPEFGPETPDSGSFLVFYEGCNFPRLEFIFYK